MPDLGSLRIVNDTPYRARQLVHCGVAFAPGLVRPYHFGTLIAATNQPLGLQGYVSSVEATTAWPDGSVRYGRLLAVPRPGPDSDELVPLGPAPELPFTFGAWAHLAAAINARLTVIRADGSRIVSPFQVGSGKNLSASPAGIVSMLKQRIPGTCLWWSMRTHVGCDSDVIPFRIRLHNSDPSRPQVREDWAEIRFDSDLPAQFPLREKLGLAPFKAPGLFGPESSISWRMSRADWLADAQGLWFWDGVFPLIDPVVHPPDEGERVESLQAAVTWPVVVEHTNMREAGLCGPFGTAGSLPEGQTLTQAEAGVNARASAFRMSRAQIATWGDWRFSEAPDTAQTGEHETHGTSLLAAEILTSNPRAIPELMLGCLGQARRPLYRYEAGLETVRKRDHPQLLYWSGNVHWPSQDKLGKGTAQATETDKHFWYGPDPEHWMVEPFLAPAALLTMDWDLLELGRQHMEHLKGHGYNQLGAFAERAQDWVSYAMAWWRLLLPGEPDDLSFVRGWEDWLVTWWRTKNARGEGGWGAGPGPVKPTIVMKDERYFWGPEGAPRLPNGRPDPLTLQPFWIVWQHYFCWGKMALELVEPHAALRAMVASILRTCDFHGWDDARRHPFGGVAWQDGGQPITSVVYVQDVWDPVRGFWTKTPGTVTSDVGTDWILWSQGGAAVAGWLAQLLNDNDWVARNALVRQWIAASVANQTHKDKLAKWGGTVPVVPVLP